MIFLCTKTVRNVHGDFNGRSRCMQTICPTHTPADVSACFMNEYSVLITWVTTSSTHAWMNLMLKN